MRGEVGANGWGGVGGSSIRCPEERTPCFAAEGAGVGFALSRRRVRAAVLEGAEPGGFGP